MGMLDTALDQSSQDKAYKRTQELAEKRKKLEELREIFITLDEDGSGLLTMEELDSAPQNVRDRAEEVAGTDDLKGLFGILDYDGSGHVTVDEFCDGIDKLNQGKLELYSLLLSNCEALKQLGVVLERFEQLERSLGLSPANALVLKDPLQF